MENEEGTTLNFVSLLQVTCLKKENISVTFKEVDTP